MGNKWPVVTGWMRRYLPLEVCGTTGEFGAAVFVYWLTGSLTVAAVAATVGATAGYYAPAYAAAVRWSMRSRPVGAWPNRFAIANVLAARSVVMEFGLAEGIDSLLIRPAAFLFFPMMTSTVVIGWIVAKLVADVGFYAVVYGCHRKFRAFIAHPPALDTKRREMSAELSVPINS